MASIDDLLEGLPKRKRKRIHGHHRLAVKTATIRSDINVTPLVDVVLVLLIIFMVVTPMITRGMPVIQPKTKNHSKKSDSGEQIVVSVTCNNPKMGPKRWECASTSVWLGPDKADGDLIVEKVKGEMRKRKNGGEVHLKADHRVNYGAVREVMERIKNGTGLPGVALGSDEEK